MQAELVSKPVTAEIPKVTKGLPRWFEATVAFLGLLIASPLIALSGLAIALSSGWPIIFTQKRVGLRGRTFDLYKLRTMRARTNGPQVTTGRDQRITGLGRFLRHTKLDELPTLWNVLRGDMSLVGPRPEVTCFVQLDAQIWQKVLAVRPGLTDPVTLRLRSEGQLLDRVEGDTEQYYLNELLPAKLKGYVAYLEARNWRSDIYVLIRTVAAVVLPPDISEVSMSDVASKDPNMMEIPSRHHLATGVQALLDLTVLAAAFVIAYQLRFDFHVPPAEARNFLVQMPLVVLLQFAALTISGARSSIWRYTDLAHINTFVYAAFVSFVIIALLRLGLPGPHAAWKVPLSVNLFDVVLAFGGTYAMRVVRRKAYERTQKRVRVKKHNGNGNGKKKRAVLLIGAGRAGFLAAKEIEVRGDLDLEIKGFVDDDRAKLGRVVVQGHKVLGNTQDLPELVRSRGINHVIITIAHASRHEIHRIVKICEEIPVKVRIIPELYEIIEGRVEISRIRDVQIEDLLGREQVELDAGSISVALAGKTVMVTGAGGSIGSELARQVQRFNPARLLLVERAEFALFEIDNELRASHPDESVVPLVADVGDESRMHAIFNLYRPQVVIHAAAHKHVPLMESNATEAAQNNVLNARLLAELAGQFAAEVFVLISTDKAVRPTSVMGATKRAAELVVQDLNRSYQTRFVAVRFGNVIGSAGSVIPIFREQIRNGGPVTITDKRMKRYFMTIPEAAQLVLQASVIGRGGEVFILHMGEPVSIMDLAETLITLSGLKPHEDIQ
ncbi:MAG TPA: polysaccharide biosynthesis protein, partial [Pyrinomonadaceae bacterium]|nr:polysaccharide biosynthesis protein [Pyrinomonadaceae bacterium]